MSGASCTTLKALFTVCNLILVSQCVNDTITTQLNSGQLQLNSGQLQPFSSQMFAICGMRVGVFVYICNVTYAYRKLLSSKYLVALYKPDIILSSSLTENYFSLTQLPVIFNIYINNIYPD